MPRSSVTSLQYASTRRTSVKSLRRNSEKTSSEIHLVKRPKKDGRQQRNLQLQWRELNSLKSYIYLLGDAL